MRDRKAIVPGQRFARRMLAVGVDGKEMYRRCVCREGAAVETRGGLGYAAVEGVMDDGEIACFFSPDTQLRIAPSSLLILLDPHHHSPPRPYRTAPNTPAPPATLSHPP